MSYKKNITEVLDIYIEQYWGNNLDYVSSTSPLPQDIVLSQARFRTFLEVGLYHLKRKQDAVAQNMVNRALLRHISRIM